MRLLVTALLVGTFAGRSADADTKNEWSVTAKPDGGFVKDIRFAADGDIVVAGNFKGPFALGDAKPLDSKQTTAFVARLTPTGTVRWLRAIDRDKANDNNHDASGLAVAADGNILVDVSAGSALLRVTVSADGTTQKTQTLLGATGIATTSIVGSDSIVIGASLTKSTCKATGLPVYRVKAGGTIAWSACNPTKTEIVQPTHVSSAADGRSAVCAGPAVMAFTTAGKRTLNAMHAEDAICEGVSIGKDGQVAALLEGVEKTMVLATWTSNAKAGWKKLCTDLMKGEDRCLLTTVVADGSELLVGVQNGQKSSIVRLDAKTGAVKASHPFGFARFKALGAKGGAVFYASSATAVGRAQ